jgi:hypothetical protein
MADADTVLQGMLIGSFTLVGIVSVFYCLYKCDRKQELKKSDSNQDLVSIEIENPV